MPNLTLKNVPEELYEQLKRAAHLHHRSINSELIACLERIFLPKCWSAEDRIERARNLRKRVKVKKISTLEIMEAKDERRS